MNKILPLTLLVLSSCTIETVNPAERGLIIDDKADHLSSIKVLPPGTHVVPFYDDFVKVDITPKDLRDEFDCLTKDNKLVRIESTAQYYPIADQVADLYKNFGDKYLGRFIGPEFRAAVRQSVGQFDSSAIDKDKIELRAKSLLDSIYNNGHIAMQSFKIEWRN